MTSDTGRGFTEWLRLQLAIKRMSQRQLAQQSGVDHSTISRLILGHTTPTLETATKLASALPELPRHTGTPPFLRGGSGSVANPIRQIEYALRADDELSDAQIRDVMAYYLAVRHGRRGRDRIAERMRLAASSPGGQAQREG